MEQRELAAWLRLALTPGVGNLAARRLLAAFGLPGDVFAQSTVALQQVLATDLALLPASDDPLASVDALEETLAELLPTADLQWEVRGETVVLRAHVGVAELEVVPLAGGRVKITTVTPPAGTAAPCDEGDALD